MEIKKYKQQGEILPIFYGAAYFDWENNYYVCYPLGLNKIVSLYRTVIFWLKAPSGVSTNYEKLASTYKRMDKNWSYLYHKQQAQLNRAERLLSRANPDPRIIQWTQLELDIKAYFDDLKEQNES